MSSLMVQPTMAAFDAATPSSLRVILSENLSLSSKHIIP